MIALPEYTTVPINTSVFPPTSLYTSFASPLIIDSSTEILPSIIIPSAGILSPDSSKTKSSTTTSLIGICIFFPSLFTLTLISDDSSVNLLKARIEPYSLILDIKEATIIASTMPTVSYQSKSLIKKIVLIPKAINNILIIGSENVSINNFKKVSCFFFVKAFLPYFSRLIITCSFVSPLLFMTTSLIKNIRHVKKKNNIC